MYVFDTIDSTNTFAKTLTKEESPHGTIVVAEEQTAGRGRLGRTWLAAKGENILFTIVFRELHALQNPALVPYAIALAVADAIQSVTGVTVKCKWPNDLLIGDKKVCGMLLESSVTPDRTTEKLIVGIGLNVNQRNFSDGVAAIATSLRQHSVKKINRVRLLQSILVEIEKRYTQLKTSSVSIIEEWKERTFIFGKKIVLIEQDSSAEVIAKDLAQDGALLIQTPDGQIRPVYAGDVSVGY